MRSGSATGSEALFRRVVDTAEEGVWVLVPGGEITFANPRVAELLGVSADRQVGRSVGEFLADGDGSGLLPRPENRERGSEPRRVELQAADGRRVSALLRSNALPDSPDGPSGTLVMLTDLTHRVQLERELATLRSAVEDRIPDRTRELAAANRKLSESVAEMEAFTYSVSHDLRGPLRALDGFSQAVIEDYGDRLDETGLEYLQRIRAASQRLGTLMDDLLALSRVGRESVRREEFDMEPMARAIMADLRSQEPDRAVEFSAEGDLEVEADPNLIGIALENLLANAFKFTRDRTPTRITLARCSIGRESAAAPDTPTFEVRDNGVGFDPEFENKLFLPFQRLHPARDFQGNGIGLATVRRIIELHGGEVGAEGRPGQGASFHFSLPTSFEARGVEPESSSDGSPESGRRDPEAEGSHDA